MEAIIEWIEGLPIPYVVVRIVWLVVVLALAWLGNFITKKFILRTVNRLVGKSKTQWDDALVENRVFLLMSHLVPAVIIYFLAPTDIVNMKLAAVIYMVVVGMLVVNAFLNSVVDVYRTYEFARRTPIRGFMQVV